jgi:hypothetical protein
MPPELAATFHHFGHMSWGGAGDTKGGDPAVRADHAGAARQVRQRWLALGEAWPPAPGCAHA